MTGGMRFLSPIFAIALAGCSVVGIRGGTEEPGFRVLADLGPVQIRQYSPRLAASVTVPGDEIAARAAGFRRLARFIFGANTGHSRVAMTAPVAQTSSNIAMTAPVAQTPGPGGWTITFYMPAKYTAETLPKPTDPGIVVSVVPGEVYGVYCFSGIPGAAPVARAREALLAGLGGSAWQVDGKVVDWFYDPPWTLPFARRNEVAVPVRAK
jgi:hypothetical protein